MTQTRERLVARALEKLKVVGSGQTASAEDTQFVDEVVEPMMADLGARNIFAWGNEDELPDDAFEHLAGLLANSCAEDFGKVNDENKRVLLETRLRMINPISLSGQPQKVEYF